VLLRQSAGSDFLKLKLDARNEPRFSQPIRQIMLMVLVMVLFGVGAYFAFSEVWRIILTSVYLNTFILVVFAIGVLTCFAQAFTLVGCVNWIEGFALDRPGHEFVKSPRLLASLSALLSDTRARQSLTSTSTRSILDSVATRLDEASDITRYIINVLIFLGLLGTFHGLATAVPAVVDTIRSLAPAEGQSAMDSFDQLMTGLEKQLGGMGTAFSSSLLGLSGSLVVGLLELFAGHGAKRFYMELEEWLSSITRISLATGDGDGAAGGSGLLGDAVEKMVYQIEDLKDVFQRNEERRVQTEGKLTALTDAIGQLATGMGSQKAVSGGSDPAVMERLASSQERIARLLERVGSDSSGGMDAEAKMRLKNIDVQLLRILEEMSAGRQDTMAELRQDFIALAQAITGSKRGSV
jgi:hypothetical protein